MKTELKANLKLALLEIETEKGVNYAEIKHANEQVVVSVNNPKEVSWIKKMIGIHFRDILKFDSEIKRHSTLLYFDIN